MRVAIIGAGAIGSLFAWFFHQAGEEVWLLEIHPDQADVIRREGISIEGLSGAHHFRPGIVSAPDEIGTADLVVVTVKAYDTDSAAATASRLLSDRTLVLTLQNGLGNLDVIANRVGIERTLGGTTAQGATFLDYGKIRHAGKGETLIGKASGPPSEQVDQIVASLRRGQAEANPTDNVSGVIWGKLLINAGINPLTAITRLKNGELTRHPGTRAVLQAAVQEGEAIARAKEIHLPYSDAVEKTESVCTATAGNISSMLQDVLKQKRTEIAHINGALADEGEKLGIPTPVNRTLTRLVETIESSYPDHLHSF